MHAHGTKLSQSFLDQATFGLFLHSTPFDSNLSITQITQSISSFLRRQAELGIDILEGRFHSNSSSRFITMRDTFATTRLVGRRLGSFLFAEWCSDSFMMIYRKVFFAQHSPSQGNGTSDGTEWMITQDLIVGTNGTIGKLNRFLLLLLLVGSSSNDAFLGSSSCRG